MVLHLLASYHYLRRDIREAKEHTDRALALFGQIGERRPRDHRADDGYLVRLPLKYWRK